MTEMSLTLPKPDSLSRRRARRRRPPDRWNKAMIAVALALVGVSVVRILERESVGFALVGVAVWTFNYWLFRRFPIPDYRIGKIQVGLLVVNVALLLANLVQIFA